MRARESSCNGSPPKFLWKELPVNGRDNISLSGGEETNKSHKNKAKSTTISNFLKDLHVQADSQSDSEIMSILDLKYCESEVSRKEGKKEFAFMFKLLIINLKEIYQEMRKYILDLKINHLRDLALLAHHISDLTKTHQRELKVKQLQIKQLKIENKAIEQFQAIKEENTELREYLKDLNQLVMTLHEKNNELEAKLSEKTREYERVKKESQSQIQSEIIKIKGKFEKLSEEIRENFEEKVHDRVLKYISKYELIRGEGEKSMSKESDDTILNRKQEVFSPRRTIKRFERTKNIISPNNRADEGLTLSWSIESSSKGKNNLLTNNQLQASEKVKDVTFREYLMKNNTKGPVKILIEKPQQNDYQLRKKNMNEIKTQRGPQRQQKAQSSLGNDLIDAIFRRNQNGDHARNDNRLRKNLN